MLGRGSWAAVLALAWWRNTIVFFGHGLEVGTWCLGDVVHEEIDHHLHYAVAVSVACEGDCAARVVDFLTVSGCADTV